MNHCWCCYCCWWWWTILKWNQNLRAPSTWRILLKGNSAEPSLPSFWFKPLANPGDKYEPIFKSWFQAAIMKPTHTHAYYMCVCLKNSLVETTQKYFLKLKSTRIGFFPLVRHGHSAPSPHHLHALAGTTAPHLSAPDTAAAGRCCPPATPHLAIHEPRQTLQILTIFFFKKKGIKVWSVQFLLNPSGKKTPYMLTHFWWNLVKLSSYAIPVIVMWESEAEGSNTARMGDSGDFASKTHPHYPPANVAKMENPRTKKMEAYELGNSSK